MDAAVRQLETAVGLYAAEGDPVAIHTLTGAARQILEDVARRRKVPGLTLPGQAEGLIRPERVAAFRAMLREAQNFLKHADRDPDRVLDFPVDASEPLLFDACLTFRRLTGEVRPWLQAFVIWVWLGNPELLVAPPDSMEKVRRFGETFRPLGRTEFFRRMLAATGCDERGATSST